MRVRLLVVLGCVIPCACGAGQPGGEGSPAGAVDAVSSEQPSAGLDAIDPCALLTEQEIAAQLDLTGSRPARPDEHYKISGDADHSGAYPVCRYHWELLDAGGEYQRRGDFELHVMTATQLKALEGVARPKTGARAAAIDGVGDEAFFAQYAPSARVGARGVSVVEFPDTHTGNGAVELLRAAVSRLR